MCVAVMASHGHGGQIGDITGSVSLNEHEIESCFPSDKDFVLSFYLWWYVVGFHLIIQKNKIIPQSLLYGVCLFTLFDFQKSHNCTGKDKYKANEYFPGFFIILFSMLEFYKNIKSPFTILRSRNGDGATWSVLVMSYSLFISINHFFFLFFFALKGVLWARSSGLHQKIFTHDFGHICDKKIYIYIYYYLILFFFC